MKKLITKLLALVAVFMLSAVNVNAVAVYHNVTAQETVPLIKSNVDANDYLVATNNWATGKSYCGYSSETIFNMSSVGRIMTIYVSNVSNFDLLVNNSTAGRSFSITIGSGSPQTITHDGTGCVTFSFQTNNTGDITIKLEGDGSGSVYPSTIILYPPSQPTIESFSVSGIDATINQTTKAITAELPYGTNLTALTPTVTIGGTATSYSPAGAQDFSNGAVTYSAIGSTTVNYSVTLTTYSVASSDNSISDLTVGGLTPSYNADTKTYSVVLPKASDLSSQIVSFTKDVTATSSITSGAAANLTSTLDFTVTAQNSDVATYHISATVGTKNIAYVTLATGNDDPYLHASLISKGYYVEDVIANTQAVSFYDNFDLAILFDVVNSSNAAALNMAGLIGTKRFLNLKAFMYGKTGWPTGTGANFTDPNAVRVASVMTNYISHPIFSGLTFADADVTLVDAGGTYRALQGVTSPGSGTVIATVANNPTAANIIEDNSNQNAMYLFVGFANGGSTFGLANISADGKKLLDNAVEYLLGDTKFVPTATSLKGTEIKGVSFDGTVVHNANKIALNVYDITGRLVKSSTQDIQMTGVAKGTYIVRSNDGILKIAIMK